MSRRSAGQLPVFRSLNEEFGWASKGMAVAQAETPRSRRAAAASARRLQGQDCPLANQGAVGKDESALA
jgi:hypothetical protein